MDTANPTLDRLISFDFREPKSRARRTAIPAADRVSPPTAETGMSASDGRARATLRPIEPMLLLHQERVRTMQIVIEQISKALRALKRPT
jgi:hypothetical protein